MAVVTFMSDYGWQDHYVGAVKASILSVNPSINILDISHDIRSFDIGHGAYVLKHVFRDFPKSTVHLVCIDSVPREGSKLIAIKLEEQYFVGFDSGLFSLISDQSPVAMVDLNAVKPVSSTFPAKEILAIAAANLASGKNIHELGPDIPEIHRLFSRKVKATKREMIGHIIRIDKYGNLITNIERTEFDTIQRLIGNKPIRIQVGREVFSSLNKTFNDVESGNCFLIWNSLGLLQIGINKGNASELLGLRLDTPISIYFSS